MGYASLLLATSMVIINSVSTSQVAGTSPESDVNVNIEKVEGPASSPNIQGPTITLGEQQIASGMANHSSDTPHLQSDNIVKEVDNEYSLSIDGHSYVDGLVGGGPDDSQQSVPNVGKPRRGRKSKSGIARTRSVKAVVEEAKEFLGKTSKETGSASLHENMHEDSNHTEKAIGNSRRKRQRAQTSTIGESEQNAGDSEGHSDSITTGGRKKKRQTAAPPTQVTGEKRYNLRRHKTAGTVSSTQDVSNGTKTVEKEVSGGTLDVGNKNPEAVVADDNIQTTALVQVSTVKTVEFKDDRVVRFAS